MTARDAAPGEAERFLPESHGALMTHEHVHRYALAASVLGGRRVLDLGSGAGYGTRLLRAARAHTVGFDLDAGAARRAWPAVRGSALQLPFADASFEAVVCFEMIEHVHEPERVIAEIARVLAPDGIAFVSTPDRRLYTDRAGNRNAFHLRELTREEFAAAIGACFPVFALHGQSLWAGSWLARLDADGQPPEGGTRHVRSAELEPDPRVERAPWVDVGTASFPAPLYLIAVCARSPATLDRTLRQIGGDHLLHDREQRILGEHYAFARALVQRDAEISSSMAHARNIEEQLDAAARRVASLESHGANLERRIADREGRITRLEEHSSNVEARLRTREADLAGLAAHAANLELELGARKARVAGLEAHVHGIEQADVAHRERVSGLERHVANVEAILAERSARVTALETHARNVEELFAQRDARIQGLEKHAQNLEALAARHEEQRSGFEAQLETLAARHEEQRSRFVTQLEALALRHEEQRAGLDARHARQRADLEAQRRALEARAAEAGALATRLAAAVAEIQSGERRIADLVEQAGHAQTEVEALQISLAAGRQTANALRSDLDRILGTAWCRLGRRLGLLD